jgi:ketosteroid isomerase-like protein
MGHDTQALAAKLKALTEGEVGLLDEVYGPDTVVWHNTDGVELSRDQVAGMIPAIAAVTTCTVEVKAHHPTADGFVQTQKYNYGLPGGSAAEFDAALVVTLDDSGRIARLDEYVDGAAMAPLIAALS